MRIPLIKVKKPPENCAKLESAKESLINYTTKYLKSNQCLCQFRMNQNNDYKQYNHQKPNQIRIMSTKLNSHHVMCAKLKY